MPAYARDGKIVCFFTPADKFKERYADDRLQRRREPRRRQHVATAFALTKLTAADEARIAALVRKAVAGQVSQRVAVT